MSQIMKAFMGVFLTLFMAVTAMGILAAYMEAPYRLRAFQRALCGIHLRRRHLRENPHQLLRCGTSSHRIQQLLPHRARSARQLRLRVRHQQQ